jgi:hypothetical protein
MLKHKFYRHEHKLLYTYVLGIFNLLLKCLYLAQILPEELTFYSTAVKSVACKALVRKAADETRIQIFL